MRNLPGDFQHLLTRTLRPCVRDARSLASVALLTGEKMRALPKGQERRRSLIPLNFFLETKGEPGKIVSNSRLVGKANLNLARTLESPEIG
ncbi:hypothetical protein M8J76_005184 [Diaphorina citri]|nr:hypothetical protein M8J76_005184 [Diaphorina citri]